MADKLKFELIAPERLLMSADVDRVTVPGTEGRFGVLAGHAPAQPFSCTIRSRCIAVGSALGLGRGLLDPAV